MRYLIAADLEGVNKVVGEPYKGLSEDCADYEVAVREAEKEINVVTAALYDGGAEQVYLWDNHGHGHNLDKTRLDPRLVDVGLDKRAAERMDFADGLRLDGVIFLGYHSKEGTVGGVLAHTYSSVAIQYYKIDGKQVGELFIDANIALAKGIPVLMLVSDDVCVKEAAEVSPDIVTVVTKYAKGRNAAVFRAEQEVYDELYAAAKRAMSEKMSYERLSFPAEAEVRFTRAEKAAEVRAKLSEKGGLRCDFGEDGHVLRATVKSIDDLRLLL